MTPATLSSENVAELAKRLEANSRDCYKERQRAQKHQQPSIHLAVYADGLKDGASALRTQQAALEASEARVANLTAALGGHEQTLREILERVENASVLFDAAVACETSTEDAQNELSVVVRACERALTARAALSQDPGESHAG